jgi:Tol biopolymer transport system component
MRFAVKLGVVAVFALVLGMMTAALADQSINWVSVSADGTVGGAAAGDVAVSDDGRFVAFTSTSALVPGYTIGNNNVFVKDMQTGEVEIVSVSSAGAQANDSSGPSLDISNDGRYVVFNSGATNLVPGDTNSQYDYFIHDRQTGETTRVLRDDGEQGNGASEGAISGNGRYVLFAGQGYLAAEPSSQIGVLVFDRVAGTTERIAGPGLTASSQPENLAISDEGRYVAFTTREFNGGEDVILFDRDTDTWEVANPRIGDVAPITRQLGLSISGDGRYVAFSSPDTIYVPGDPADTNDVFIYDSNSGTLERIPGGGGCCATTLPLPVLSFDGRYVVFTFYGDIYGAANGHSDVVVYDRQTDTPEVVSIYNDGSPGDRASGTYLSQPALSGDGRFAAFYTQEAFDPADFPGGDVYIVDREGTTGPAPGGECTHDFTDVDGSNVFEDDICWLADQGITRGCNPPANTEFCPKDPVTRGQMAAFLVRALGYTDNGGGDLFTDDDTSVFEGDIDRLGTAGVTRGCNPPANTEFCPLDNVTRGQMAAFLVRALGYVDDGGGDLFDDDDGSVFEADIDRLGTAGVTRGCNPPANTLFCPTDDVTREQMAAFLRRALDG